MSEVFAVGRPQRYLAAERVGGGSWWVCYIHGVGFPAAGFGDTADKAQWSARLYMEELAISPAYREARRSWRPTGLSDPMPRFEDYLA